MTRPMGWPRVFSDVTLGMWRSGVPAALLSVGGSAGSGRVRGRDVPPAGPCAHNQTRWDLTHPGLDSRGASDRRKARTATTYAEIRGVLTPSSGVIPPERTQTPAAVRS